MEIQLRNFIHGLSFVFCLLILLDGHGQTKRMERVEGLASIINISPEEAKLKAIAAAKVEALRMAGVNEWIQSFDFLEKKEEGKKYDEFFHSLTSVQVMGSITNWELIEEEKKSDGKNLIYRVLINATVLLYKTQPDPEFQITVDGLKNRYKHLDPIAFKIQPNKKGFLSVFLMDEESNVSLLYPGENETNSELSPQEKYNFPKDTKLKYEIFTEREIESNYLFFVFTKKNIPYSGKASFSEFVEYVYSMEPDSRFVDLRKFKIYK